VTTCVNYLLARTRRIKKNQEESRRSKNIIWRSL